MKQKRDTGTVLVLITMLLAALIGIVALAIDGGMVAARKQALDRTAAAAALAALETFTGAATDPVLNSQLPALSEPPTPAELEAYYQKRMELAALRASKVANVNLTTTFTRRFLTDTSNPDTQFGADVLTPDANGEVVPGTWYFVQPVGETVCESTGSFKPCFVPFETGDLTSLTVPNAFRIEITDADSSLLGPVFAQVLGANPIKVDSFATAALVPRRLSIVFDTSPSSTRSNYLQESGNIGKFVYFVGKTPALSQSTGEGIYFTEDPVPPGGLIAHPVGSGAGIPWECSDYNGGDPTVPAERLPWYLSYLDLDNLKFFQMDDTNPNEDAITKDDYKCYNLDWNYSTTGYPEPGYDYSSIVSAGAPTEQTLINVNVSPQPLTDILAGVHYAMRRFDERSAAGDGIGILGFEEEVILERSTLGIIDPSHQSTWELFLDSTNTQGGEEYPGPWLGDLSGDLTLEEIDRVDYTTHNAIDRMFLPTFGSFSDITLAVQEGGNWLALATGAAAADNHIILISDGMINCLKDPVDLPPGFNTVKECHTDPTNTQKFGGVTGPPPRCASTDAHFWGGFEEFMDLADEFSSQDVKLHIALVGAHVSPNTIYLARDGGGPCLSSSEVTTLRDTSLRLDSVNNVDNLISSGTEPTYIRSYGRTTRFAYMSGLGFPGGLACANAEGEIDGSSLTRNCSAWPPLYCNLSECNYYLDVHLPSHPHCQNLTGCENMGSSAANPCPLPNYLSEATVVTQGLWNPIRNPCPPALDLSHAPPDSAEDCVRPDPPDDGGICWCDEPGCTYPRICTGSLCSFPPNSGVCNPATDDCCSHTWSAPPACADLGYTEEAWQETCRVSMLVSSDLPGYDSSMGYIDNKCNDVTCGGGAGACPKSTTVGPLWWQTPDDFVPGSTIYGYSNSSDDNRFRCDPECRKPVDQIKGLIDSIMAENPYILVE